MASNPLLEITNVSKRYRRGKTQFTAVNGVSLKIQPKEIVGLIGESGCGKSTLAKMIAMLEKPCKGTICFNQHNLFEINANQRFEIRRQIQIIFQNPLTALDPRMTLQQILCEPLDIHSLFTGFTRYKRVNELIDMVGLERNHLNRYPSQFSGGQLQRICIARALAVEPTLLICDEPLSALDLSIQAQIINLLRKCQNEMGIAMLFISHDLAAVDMLADRVAVMYQGEIVEQGLCRDVLQEPQHPYTQSLLKN